MTRYISLTTEGVEALNLRGSEHVRATFTGLLRVKNMKGIGREAKTFRAAPCDPRTGVAHLAGEKYDPLLDSIKLPVRFIDQIIEGDEESGAPVTLVGPMDPTLNEGQLEAAALQFLREATEQGQSVDEVCRFYADLDEEPEDEDDEPIDFGVADHDEPVEVDEPAEVDEV